jgi:shikimate kinase
MQFSDRPLKVALVGFMGSGKTTVGRALAAILGLPFIDLDAAIEIAAGKSVGGIFAEEGEAAFRVREAEALRSFASRGEGMILACGGGVIVSEANRRTLGEGFFTVWLDVPFSELMKRLSSEAERAARPLLRSESYRVEAEALYRSRMPFYREASRVAYRWESGKSVKDAALAIAELLAAAAES